MGGGEGGYKGVGIRDDAENVEMPTGSDFVKLNAKVALMINVVYT